MVKCIHDVAAACRLAMADVRVRLPLDALGCTCDVMEACRLGRSVVWVRLPPGDLDNRGDTVEPDGPLTPLWCIGEHATLSKWKDGFDSRQGR